MSRIGRKPITIPNGVEANVKGNVVSVKGPKGSLSVALHPHVTVEVAPDKTVVVSVKNGEAIEDRAIWGTTRRLISNAVDGVTKGFEEKLEFIGVGFRVSVTGSNVTMEVGFSHPVTLALPAGISGTVEKNTLTISGIDKQLVGETAARIRRIKPPEPYKGKGIKYSSETIRRKAGKAAKSSAA